MPGLAILSPINEADELNSSSPYRARFGYGRYPVSPSASSIPTVTSSPQAHAMHLAQLAQGAQGVHTIMRATRGQAPQTPRAWTTCGSTTATPKTRLPPGDTPALPPRPHIIGQ